MWATIIKPSQNMYIAADKIPLRDTMPEYKTKVRNSAAFHLSTSTIHTVAGRCGTPRLSTYLLLRFTQLLGCCIDTGLQGSLNDHCFVSYDTFFFHSCPLVPHVCAVGRNILKIVCACSAGAFITLLLWLRTNCVSDCIFNGRNSSW